MPEYQLMKFAMLQGSCQHLRGETLSARQPFFAEQRTCRTSFSPRNVSSLAWQLTTEAFFGLHLRILQGLVVLLFF